MMLTFKLSTGKQIELTVEEFQELKTEIESMKPVKDEGFVTPLPYRIYPPTPYIARTVDGSGDGVPVPSIQVWMEG